MSDINILDEVAEVLDRYITFPSEEARDAVVLWAAHTHYVDALPTTPRLAVLSSEPGSGKSTVLKVLRYLVPRAVAAQHITGPALLRLVKYQKPTILYDEIDTVFGGAGSSTRNQDVRAMLNAGNERGTYNYRAVGPSDVVAEPLFAPVALAGLGILPDTLMSRSIVVRMKSRKHGQPDIMDFEMEYDAEIVSPFGKELEDWALSNMDKMRLIDPVVPGKNRTRQIWKPLFKIAQIAGGEWPDRVKRSFVEMTREPGKEQSLPHKLLSDLQVVFTSGEGPRAYVPSSTLIDELTSVSDMWQDLSPRSLADMLRRYGISTRTANLPSGASVRAYHHSDLESVWERYL